VLAQPATVSSMAAKATQRMFMAYTPVGLVRIISRAL